MSITNLPTLSSNSLLTKCYIYLFIYISLYLFELYFLFALLTIHKQYIFHNNKLSGFKRVFLIAQLRHVGDQLMLLHCEGSLLL